MNDETNTRGCLLQITGFIAGLTLLFLYVGRFEAAGIAAIVAYFLFRQAMKL